MFLFQTTQSFVPVQKTDSQTVEAFMSYVRSHADGAILVYLQRMPNEMGAWRSELVKVAGGEKEYLGLLRELLSRAKEMRLQLRDHLPEAQVLGFFYGYEMRLQLNSQASLGGGAKPDTEALKRISRLDMGQFISESPVLSAAAESASLAVKLANQTGEQRASARMDYKRRFDKKGVDVGIGGAPAKSGSRIWQPENVNIFYSAPRVVNVGFDIYNTVVASNMPGATKFQETIDNANTLIGITRNGGTFTQAGDISGAGYLAYRNNLFEGFRLSNDTGWFNTEDYDDHGNLYIVKDVVARDLVVGASLEQVAAKLQTGDWLDAQALFVPGSPTYKAFGDQSSFKKAISVLDETSLLRLMSFSMSTGAGVSYRLGESDQSPVFHIVATGTRDFLVTNQRLDNLSLGAWTVMTIKPTKTKLRIGGGVQLSSSKPSFYLAVGAEQNIPINKFLRVVLDGTAAATYSKSLAKPLLYNADIGAGLKANFKRIEVGIKSDFFLVSRGDEFFKGAKGVFTFDYTPANWAKIGVYGEIYTPSEKASGFIGDQQYVSKDWPAAIGLRLNFSPSSLFRGRAKPGEQ